MADEVGRIEQSEPVPEPAPAEDDVPPSKEITAAPVKSHKADGRKPPGTIVSFEDHATPGQRIAYKIPGEKIFLEVKVQRAAIVLHLADGGCPDPNRIADDIPASHGWRQLKKRIAIVSMADLDAAMPFIEAAFRAERP